MPKLIIKIVAIGAFMGAILIVTPWIAKFHGPLSDNSADWAAFGTYLGGTISPLLSALALIALLFNLTQQQEQIASLRRQSAKEDLLRAVEKLEKDFTGALELYPIKYQVSGITREYSGLDVVCKPAFLDYKDIMTTPDELKDHSDEEGKIHPFDPKLSACEMFSMAAGHLNQLRLFVEKHDELAGNNAMGKYYQRKYKLAFERFAERKFLPSEWRAPT